MLLAQMTDLHIKGNGKLAYNRVDTVKFVKDTVQHINHFMPKIDAVIISGDLTDNGTMAEYEYTKSLLNQLNMPYYVVPGNHDQRKNLYDGFRENNCFMSGSYIHYSIDDFPLRLIGLDTLVEQKPHGYLPSSSLNWLDKQLNEQPEKPTLIFMHHPPFKTGIEHMDVQNLLNAEEFIKLIDKHSCVKQVACGHVHRAIQTVINSTVYSIAPNAAHATVLNLGFNAQPCFTLEPPALQLFRLDEKNKLTSHISYIGHFDGPHPYFNSQGQLIE
ncbi:MAG: serine/threonine protein phosphatase [Hyphomicrobiales bacterium]|nr:MAG: serine/threonine protein phosphatase [Hyphomicrobiales bacterium]